MQGLVVEGWAGGGVRLVDGELARGVGGRGQGA